ncbi:uncharacterized protein LOC110846076 isoform X1 [Folsomia candida]|uniref:uncharacterized protein LOC110846076 isoform X1 n=1 Tax=Folsomia candida TaxID=158441 RepID=UPI000B8F617C|nr:uncharacterized protein LOC110846076 isoform X1 [Folsomia candida]XP_035705539.1 uncharacterized protein LOC110846076 isoform X1 [Folsomia candida]
MQSTFLPAVINMRRIGILASATLCILLPLVLGAPASDDSLKQQIASGLLRGDDFWSSLNQELYSDDPLQRLASQYNVRTRSGGLDSLGRGNILRSLDGMGNDWGDSRSNNWRLGYVGGGSPKRGGGLDSLGRGNILRRVSYDDEVANFIHALGSAGGKLRSLDSLGKGNILKRSVRVA